MTPDELFDWAVEHPDYEVWRRFYHDAWKLSCDLAAGTPFHPRNVAYAIAALSPMVSWTTNVNLARSAVALTVESLDLGFTVGWDVALADLRCMTARKRAAYEALIQGVAPSGPKVSAFAFNIAGDLTFVTVDRHMLDIFSEAERPHDACTAWCRNKGTEVGLWPAEVQAVLWGARRATKGYTTY